jgi:hypothetical protein
MTEQIKPCELPCEKCGSLDVNRQFYAKGSNAQAPSYGTIKNKFFHNPCNTHHNQATADHIHHHCRCCQYAWATRPIKRIAKPRAGI